MQTKDKNKFFWKTFGGVLVFVALTGIMIFCGNLAKTARAQGYVPVTCSDGSTNCGAFGAYIISGQASCSFNGRANNGVSATCSNKDANGTFYGGQGAQLWLKETTADSYVIPSTQPGTADFNPGPIFANSPVGVIWGASHAGSVSIGTIFDSYDPCSPYAIGKTGCNGFSNRVANGTANPGDTPTLTATMLHADNNMNSTCTVGVDCGVWANGSISTLEVTDATYCYRASSTNNNNYIIPDNSSSGKRDYVATAQGICTWDNPPAPTACDITKATFTASPTSINNGGTSTLNWGGIVANGNAISISNVGSNLSQSGNATVYPPDSTSTTYTLTCGTQTANQTVTTTAVPVPALSAGWGTSIGGSTNQTITLTPGQTQITVPLTSFTFWNSGASGSTAKNIICGYTSSKNFTGTVSIPTCTPNELTAQ